MPTATASASQASISREKSCAADGVSRTAPNLMKHVSAPASLRGP